MSLLLILRRKREKKVADAAGTFIQTFLHPHPHPQHIAYYLFPHIA